MSSLLSAIHFIGTAFTPETALLSLFVSAFLAATLLPGGSELALVAVLSRYPESWLGALLWATLGNTLGGLSSYWLGRLLPQPYVGRKAGVAGVAAPTTVRTRLARAPSAHSVAVLTRYGYALLLLSWIPLIGDALCVAAGWLRMRVAWVVLLIALGKLARYGVVAWMALGFFSSASY